jgi:hypothetical protein
MKKGIPLLVMVALFALALFTPAAMALDDDAGTATATPTATATATDGAGDDERGAAAAAAGALPRTGGPALIGPVAGALLLGSGVIAGVVGLRRRSS